jgi:hypothetical protein
LLGATAADVSFYITPVIPPSGGIRYPKIWNELRTKKVRVTGVLKFRSFGKKDEKAIIKSNPPAVVPQTAPDYFYMDLQETKLELDE